MVRLAAGTRGDNKKGNGDKNGHGKENNRGSGRRRADAGLDCGDPQSGGSKGDGKTQGKDNSGRGTKPGGQDGQGNGENPDSGSNQGSGAGNTGKRNQGKRSRRNQRGRPRRPSTAGRRRRARKPRVGSGCRSDRRRATSAATPGTRIRPAVAKMVPPRRAMHRTVAAGVAIPGAAIRPVSGQSGHESSQVMARETVKVGPPMERVVTASPAAEPGILNLEGSPADGHPAGGGVPDAGGAPDEDQSGGAGDRRVVAERTRFRRRATVRCTCRPTAATDTGMMYPPQPMLGVMRWETRATIRSSRSPRS